MYDYYDNDHYFHFNSSFFAHFMLNARARRHDSLATLANAPRLRQGAGIQSVLFLSIHPNTNFCNLPANAKNKKPTMTPTVMIIHVRTEIFARLIKIARNIFS